jgi:microcystin-dependent protein
MMMDVKICRFFTRVCLLFAVGSPVNLALAEDTPFVGEMIWVPYTFAPKGWAFCNGQILPISQNTALFSLLGTTYGGDGKSTFALPNMQGRVMINAGVSSYVQGESSGEATHTLLPSEMPAHSHGFQASIAAGTASNPAGNLYGQSVSGKQYGQTPATSMKDTVLGVTIGNQPHNNMMPYGTLNCIIALQGIFPSRP